MLPGPLTDCTRRQRRDAAYELQCNGVPARSTSRWRDHPFCFGPPAGVWATIARGTPPIGKAFLRAVLSRPKGAQVKKILELICCILHPIAVFLIWITVWFNKNLNTGQKIVWAIVSIVPFVPFVYVLTGNDFL